MNSLRPPQTGAELEIRYLIEACGPITFAEFMAIALRWPDGGYYSTRLPLGPSGDFYTAPLTHPVFGALLAREIAEMWRASGSPDRWWVVEPGAGNGRLAADVSAAVELEHKRLVSSLRYLAVDLSQTVGEDAEVEWARSNAIPVRDLCGVVLGNELFDALPVHRVTTRDGQLRELRVGVGDEGEFADVIAPPTDGIQERLERLGVRLAEGHVTEVCLEANRWLEDAGAAIASGYLLLIDYGHESSAYYDESRNRGTLRTYYRHTLGMDPYQHVGRQDLSVHVEFTSVREIAAHAGFTDVGVTTQGQFLRNLGFDTYREAVLSLTNVPQAIKAANVRAMDSLVDPEGMGGFKVVAFSKSLPDAKLIGFDGPPPSEEVVAALAGPRHMPLPGMGQEEIEMPTWGELLQ